MKVEEKSKLVSDLVAQFSGVKGMWFTDFTGLSVERMTELRRLIRESGYAGIKPAAIYKVVKKRLLLRVLAKLNIEPLEDWFQGSVGVCVGDDVVLCSRILSGFSGLKVKGCWYEGELLGPDRIKEIAGLPGREVLIGELLGELTQVLSGLVSVLSSVLSNFLRVIEGVKKSKS